MSAAEPPSTPLLEYGKQDPRITRLTRRLPRPSVRTIALLVIAVAAGFWLRAEWEPWQVVRTFPAGSRELAPAVSADGTRMIAAAPDSVRLARPEDFYKISVYDVRDGTVHGTFDGRGRLPDVELSRDGHRALLRLGQSAVLFDGETGRELTQFGPLRPFERGGMSRSQFVLSPDGQRIVTLEDARAMLYDAADGREIGELERQEPGGASVAEDVIFSPDGKLLSVAMIGGGRARVHASDDDRVVATFDASAASGPWGFRQAFSPDGRLLAVGVGGDVLLCDIARGEERWRYDAGAPRVPYVGFSVDGSRVLLSIINSAGTATIEAVDVSTGARAASSAGSGNWAEGFPFPPDGGALAGPRMLDARTLIGLPAAPPAQDFGPLRFSPDGKSLASPRAGSWRSISIWNTSTWSVDSRVPLPPGGHSFDEVMFVDGSHLLAQMDRRQTIGLWHLRRPPAWWGVVVLPQFWLAIAASAAFVWSAVADRRSRRWRPVVPIVG